MDGGRVDEFFERTPYLRNDDPSGVTKILFMRAALRRKHQKQPPKTPSRCQASSSSSAKTLTTAQHSGYSQPDENEAHYSTKALELKKVFDFWAKNHNARYLYVILQDNGRLDCHVQGSINPAEPEMVQKYWQGKGFAGEVIAAFDLERYFDTQLEEAGVCTKTLMSWERFRARPLNGIIRQAALPAPPEVPLIMGPKKPTLVFTDPGLT